MKPVIERWDDMESTHFHVCLPLQFWLKKKSQIQLTKLMLRLIWGVGTTKKEADANG